MSVEIVGQGAPVIVFHGTPGSRLDARFWAEAAATAAATAQFIGFDRPGYGDEPPQPGRNLQTVAEFAADLVDDDVYLLGLSGGGPFALATAQLLGGRAAKTIIVSGMSPPEFGLGVLSPIMGMSREELVAWAEDLISGIPGLTPTGNTLVDLFLASTAEGVRRVDGVIDDLLTLRQPWEIDLAAVASDVILFHAVDDDRCAIGGARFLAQSLPNATLIEWESGGHMALAFHGTEVLSALP